MRVSEFLQKEMPEFLLGAFYGRYGFSKDEKYIYTYSDYRNGAIYDNEKLCELSKDKYVIQLNKICEPYTFWKRKDSLIPRVDILFVLENDLNLNKSSFFNRLNTKIYSSDFIYDSEFTQEKKMFIRGFSELRASVDRNRNLLAMDYVYNSQQEVKRVRLLIDYLNVPTYIVNYNFREFQPEYNEGKKRATQLRYNINWYASHIGFINEYKISVYEHNFYHTGKKEENGITYFICPVPLKSDNTTFESRLAYYSNNVLGKKLTKEDFNKFSKLIGTEKGVDSFKRDWSIVNYVRYTTPDVCVCCCDDYDIKDRTHIEARTGRYHFEIHHMISVGQNKELDDVDNLAKICPSCHASLGRGSADENTQKQLIIKIFNHKPNILEFCKSYFDEEDFETVVHNVWESLK